MTMKQERAQERFRNRETNEQIAREADEFAQRFIAAPNTVREFLHSPDLFFQLRGDIRKAGLVGEGQNAIAIWVTATSRYLEKPLNAIIKGHSSAGKNFLANTVLKFFPAEETVRASSLSPHAMNYMGRNALSHKIFYVDELSSTKANHPARQLMSEGRVVHRVPTMQKGHWVTQEVVTEGPVACLTTTTATALRIDDESRNFSLWVDESWEQTKAIAKRAAVERVGLHPDRLALWHEVQKLVGEISGVPVATPPWFEVLVEKILPYGDLRIRRFWPAFIAATKIVCMVNNAWMGKKWIERQKGLTISFDDFAITTHIFDKIIAQSFSRSGRDEDLATADIVKHVLAKHKPVNGVSAGDLVGEPGIRSLDIAYRLLSRAAQAGAIVQTNPRDKNNEKRYMPTARAPFLGRPDLIALKLGLKIAGEYSHPATGEICRYGKE